MVGIFQLLFYLLAAVCAVCAVICLIWGVVALFKHPKYLLALWGRATVFAVAAFSSLLMMCEDGETGVPIITTKAAFFPVLISVILCPTGWFISNKIRDWGDPCPHLRRRYRELSGSNRDWSGLLRFLQGFATRVAVSITVSGFFYIIGAATSLEIVSIPILGGVFALSLIFTPVRALID